MIFGMGERYRLDVQSLDFKDERRKEIATVIAEEVERERDAQQALFPRYDNESGVGLLGIGKMSYADSLCWDVLLTFNGCVFRCADRLKMPPETIVRFAADECWPNNVWVLHWFGRALKAIGESIQHESGLMLERQQREALQEKQERIKAGAMRGGAKSALRRRAIQSTPPGPQLRGERDKLIQDGMEARNVASFLAKRYGVSSAAIRAGYLRN